MRFSRVAIPLFAVLLFSQVLLANSITIDFEGFPDSTILTTQYPGLTFSDATILSAGISLNEFEFPPASGTNVVFDDGGPMSVSFASPITNFGGFFSYALPLTLQGFDATSNLIATVTSAFSNNMALSGDTGSSPNEFLQLAFAGGISSITITGDLAGGSFVLDDLTYTPAAALVPEPNSIYLLVSGAASLLAFRRRLL